MRYYEVLPECKAELEEFKRRPNRIGTLYLLIQLMLRTPADEAKMIDEHLTYISEILALTECRNAATSTTKLCVSKKSRNAKNSTKTKWNAGPQVPE